MPWHEEDGLRDFSLSELNRYFIRNHVMMSCNPSMHIEVSVKLENSAGKHQLLLQPTLNYRNGDNSTVQGPTSLLTFQGQYN